MNLAVGTVGDTAAETGAAAAAETGAAAVGKTGIVDTPSETGTRTDGLDAIWMSPDWLSIYRHRLMYEVGIPFLASDSDP